MLITGLDTPDIRRCAAGFLAKDDLSIQSVTLAVIQAKLTR
jgi:hypothetical protein